jgi:hypothetical protein
VPARRLPPGLPPRLPLTPFTHRPYWSRAGASVPRRRPHDPSCRRPRLAPGALHLRVCRVEAGITVQVPVHGARRVAEACGHAVLSVRMRWKW